MHAAAFSQVGSSVDLHTRPDLAQHRDPVASACVLHRTVRLVVHAQFLCAVAADRCAR